MASIVRSGKAWCAFVCRKDTGGQTVRRSATFASNAREWAAAQEVEICTAPSTVQASRTADRLERYRREVSPGKRGVRWEELGIGLMLRDELAAVKIGVLDRRACAIGHRRLARPALADRIRRHTAARMEPAKETLIYSVIARSAATWRSRSC